MLSTFGLVLLLVGVVSTQNSTTTSLLTTSKMETNETATMNATSNVTMVSANTLSTQPFITMSSTTTQPSSSMSFTTTQPSSSMSPTTTQPSSSMSPTTTQPSGNSRSTATPTNCRSKPPAVALSRLDVDKPNLAVGTKVTYRCLDGYTMACADPVAECWPSGEWVYRNCLPSCVKVGESTDTQRDRIFIVLLVVIGVLVVTVISLIIGFICVKYCKFNQRKMTPPKPQFTFEQEMGSGGRGSARPVSFCQFNDTLDTAKVGDFKTDDSLFQSNRQDDDEPAGGQQEVIALTDNSQAEDLANGNAETKTTDLDEPVDVGEQPAEVKAENVEDAAAMQPEAQGQSEVAQGSETDAPQPQEQQPEEKTEDTSSSNANE